MRTIQSNPLEITVLLDLFTSLCNDLFWVFFWNFCYFHDVNDPERKKKNKKNFSVCVQSLALPVFLLGAKRVWVVSFARKNDSPFFTTWTIGLCNIHSISVQGDGRKSLDCFEICARCAMQWLMLPKKKKDQSFFHVKDTTLTHAKMLIWFQTLAYHKFISEPVNDL